MRAQVGSKVLPCRLPIHCIRKERRLTVVEKAAVNQRHPAALRLRRITHGEKLRRRVPAERRAFHSQIRPDVTAALCPGKGNEMELCSIGITAYHMKETSDRSAMSHGLRTDNLPSRRREACTQKLRESPAVCRLGCRRLDKEQRGEIRSGGEGAQRKRKRAE